MSRLLRSSAPFDVLKRAPAISSNVNPISPSVAREVSFLGVAAANIAIVLMNDMKFLEHTRLNNVVIRSNNLRIGRKQNHLSDPIREMPQYSARWDTIHALSGRH